MKILVDMNLSPDWVPAFTSHGITAVHWSTVGDPRAKDSMIMNWESAHGYVVFTHDLDFGAALALTQAKGPSVIQVRTQDVSPQHLEPAVISILQNHASPIETGCLIVLDEVRSRVRILPLSRRP
jgi:predicted nuclease of predicted toxin-antitoxin system